MSHEIVPAVTIGLFGFDLYRYIFAEPSIAYGVILSLVMSSCWVTTVALWSQWYAVNTVSSSGNIFISDSPMRALGMFLILSGALLLVV